MSQIFVHAGDGGVLSRSEDGHTQPPCGPIQVPDLVQDHVQDQVTMFCVVSIFFVVLNFFCTRDSEEGHEYEKILDYGH